MILFKIIHRKSWDKDEGTMGFHDYVTHYENFEDFIDRIEVEANIIDLTSGFTIINISFIDDKTAVIVYRQLEQEN